MSLELRELLRQRRSLEQRRLAVAALLAGRRSPGDQLSRKTLDELARLIEAARLEALDSLEWRGRRLLVARLRRG